MTDNTIQFPSRDLIKEMTGPAQSGHSVVIDGRIVPNMVMYDRGDEIEFVIDHRSSYSFPREIAWQVADFAFTAMAIAAGFAHYSGTHFTQRPYAPQIVNLGDRPPQGK